MKTTRLTRTIGALLLGGACQFGCTSQTAVAIAKLAAHDAAAESPFSGPEVGDLPRDIPVEAKPDLGPEAGSDSRIILDGGATVLFFDNFDRGYAANWKMAESADGPVTDAFSDTNRIARFDSSNADVSRLRCNLDGSYFTEMDISASLKVRIDAAPSSTRVVRMTVRQSGSNYFYAVGVTVTKDGSMTNVGVYKKVPVNNNDYTEVALATSPPFVPPIPMGTWRTMRITLSGATSVRLAVAFEGEPGATFTDDCTSILTSTAGDKVPNGGCIAGQTGLGIQVEKGIVASVDDVLVTTP